MGLDVYTHTIVGAELKEEEIFVRTETVPRRCAECPSFHAAQQKFCGECGLKFSPLKVVTTWTPNVLAYLQSRGKGLSPEDLRTGDYEDYGSPFFNVRPVQTAEDRDQALWAIGVKFDGTSMNRPGRSTALGWAQLDRAKQDVEATLQGIGLPAREIKLYPIMYVSY